LESIIFLQPEIDLSGFWSLVRGMRRVGKGEQKMEEGWADSGDRFIAVLEHGDSRRLPPEETLLKRPSSGGNEIHRDVSGAFGEVEMYVSGMRMREEDRTAGDGGSGTAGKGWRRD
jgi:hypothetical protein